MITTGNNKNFQKRKMLKDCFTSLQNRCMCIEKAAKEATKHDHSWCSWVPVQFVWTFKILTTKSRDFGV